MAYRKDSMVIVIGAGEDGYSTSYYVFNRNPPPSPNLSQVLESIPDAAPELDENGTPTGGTTAGVRDRQDRISADKASLKTEIGQAVDQFFDVGNP